MLVAVKLLNGIVERVQMDKLSVKEATRRLNIPRTKIRSIKEVEDDER